jgi:sporulation-control protein spo0M
MTKAAASRNFGTRKVDEYLKDDSFWAGQNLTTLKKGLREAAFAVISEFPKP